MLFTAVFTSQPWNEILEWDLCHCVISARDTINLRMATNLHYHFKIPLVCLLASSPMQAPPSYSMLHAGDEAMCSSRSMADIFYDRKTVCVCYQSSAM